MANVDWPSGLRPVGNGTGGTAPRITAYNKVAGIIYEGDVLYAAEGGVAVYNGTTDANANNIVGVAVNYSATAADTDMFVYDDPNQEYLAQCDDDSIGSAANMNAARLRHAPVVYATGNTTTLQSKLEVDASGITSTWTLDTPLLVVRPWHDDSNAYGTNYKVVVKIDHRNHIITNDSITRIT